MTIATRMLAGIAFMAAGALTPSYADDSDWIAPGRVPVLDMFNQLSLERHALRIAAMPQVEQQVKLAKEFYRKSHWGKRPDARATLDRAAEAYKMFAAQVAVINDPARPTVMWAEQVPHDWFGVKWPGSQWGVDNPDNFYRYIVVDGQSRYEIHGRRSGSGPVQETFLVYANLPGTGAVNGEGAPVVASISSEDFKYGPDGSFTFTIGPEPAQPGEVHMQTKPEAKVIFIRDTLQDWHTQFPNQLRVRRVSGPPAPPVRTDLQMADEAAETLKKVVPYWFDFNENYQYKKPANKIVQGFSRAGGWGFIAGGWFDLKPDEALVVTLDPLSASYFAVQTSDVWMFASAYAKHLGGLNKAQAKPNADGSFTFVIAAKDPGVWNWIDTEGMNVGTFGGRWQQLGDPNQTSDKAVRGSKVVKIADLKKALPADTAWVTPEQRRKQLEDRAASFALRFTN
jgi:hypothetical protein